MTQKIKFGTEVVTVPRLVNCFQQPEKWEDSSVLRRNFVSDSLANSSLMPDI